MEWRQQFNKDVIIDIICYRRHGHDDLEDPMVSNPHTYERIRRQRPVLDQYTEHMVAEGVVTLSEASGTL